MKDFIAEHQRLENLADHYLDEMYKLQEEFDITLELGDIEQSFYADGLVVSKGNLFIQVHKCGYDWSGISGLVKFPENIDAKLQELRKYCLEQVKQKELEYQQRVEKSRLEKEENERAEYERLHAKYSNK
jgi:hypothetical protein